MTLLTTSKFIHSFPFRTPPGAINSISMTKIRTNKRRVFFMIDQTTRETRKHYYIFQTGVR